jgi:tripartite-type tricarboxylate transporter receptor subunit TctC
MSTRRQTLKALGAGGIAASLGLPLHSRAQGALLDNLKIVVGFPPGGTTDAFARGLAEKLRGKYATTTIVENKPGAGGQIGVTTVRDAAPDGSVMLLTPGSMMTIYPYTYTKLT